MKKFLLLFSLLVTGFCAWAQTSVETALDLAEGSNSYEFGTSGTYQSAYFKYTAPTDQSQLLTLTTTDQNVSINVSEDGGYSTAIQGITLQNGTKRIYPVKKGQTIYVVASTYSGSSVSFQAASTAYDVEAGGSLSQALTATDGTEFFVPSFYDTKTYTSHPTYIAYTATESGVLEMEFTSYVSNATIQAGTDGTAESLSFNYNSETQGYSGKYAVEGGVTYYIATSLYSPVMGTFTLTHPTEGASCDLPFAATTDTPNVLPAAAGKYWYQLMPDKSGFAVLRSEATLPGGTLTAYNSCASYASSLSTVNGLLLMRVAAQSGQSLYFCIEKAEATAEAETFTLALEDAQAGDSFDNPIDAQEGENTVSEFNGTYYYRIQIPESGSKMIGVDASEANILSSSTQMYLIDSSNQWSQLAMGSKSLSYEGQAGKTYILKWQLNEGKNAFSFKLTLTDIAKGDVASNPLQAVKGENELPEGTVKYFTYTATQNGWLSIDTEPNITVTFPRDTYGYSFYDAQTSGTVTRMQATSGTTYLIKFTGMTEATSFTLSEDAYQQGESKDNPIEITDEATALPNATLSRWYVYTAPQDGKLTVSSDIAYESENGKTSMVSVQLNDGYPQTIINYGGQEGSETYFKGTFNVSKGDKAYIQVITLTPQEGRTLTCTIADLQPGEAASNPIPLNEGETVVPEATYSNPVWYSVDLKAGDFKITGKTGDDYFYGTLYSANDLNNPVAYSSSTWDAETNTQTYYLSYTYSGTDNATFIFCVQRTNVGGATIVVSGDNVVTGIESLSRPGNVRIENGNVVAPAGSRLTVYGLDGRKLHDTTDASTLHLNKGVYIVNGAKVIIR